MFMHILNMNHPWYQMIQLYGYINDINIRPCFNIGLVSLVYLFSLPLSSLNPQNPSLSLENSLVLLRHPFWLDLSHSPQQQAVGQSCYSPPGWLIPSLRQYCLGVWALWVAHLFNSHKGCALVLNTETQYMLTSDEPNTLSFYHV